MDRTLASRFDQIVRRHAELAAALSAAGLGGGEFAKLSKEYSELGPIVAGIENLRRTESELAAAAEMAEMADDPEMKALAEDEMRALREMCDCPGAGSGAALDLLSYQFELFVECEERRVVDQRGR